MRVLSMRRTFESDHSSSTYQFCTSRRLSDAEKDAVAKLCGRTPRGKRLQIQYMGEREISGRVEDQLLARYYDVEVSESYDWWTGRVSLDYDESLWKGLKPCEGRGVDDLGVDVERVADRIIVSLYFMMDYSAAFDAFGEDPFDGLEHLFEVIREDILVGDFSALYAICDFYNAETESEAMKLSKNAKELQGVLDRP